MPISQKDIANPEQYHEVVVELYNKSEDAIKKVILDGFKDNKEINLFVWINFLTTMIANVEKYRKLTGKTKQRVLLDICLIIVDKAGEKLSDENKFAIKVIIKNTFPEIIDQLVALSKKINTKKRIGKCFSKEFSCLLLDHIPEPETPIVIPEPIVEEPAPVVIEEPVPIVIED